MTAKQEVVIIIHHAMDVMKRVQDGSWGHKMLSNPIKNLSSLILDEDSALHRMEINEGLLEEIDSLKEELEGLTIKQMVDAKRS